MPVRSRAITAAVPFLLVGLAACSSGDQGSTLTPVPSTPVTAAPVPGLSLKNDEITSLVLQFRTQWTALSAGRDDTTVVTSFVGTCTALAANQTGADPQRAGVDAAVMSFTTPNAAQALPSVDDALGLSLLAREQVCSHYTAPAS